MKASEALQKPGDDDWTPLGPVTPLSELKVWRPTGQPPHQVMEEWAAGTKVGYYKMSDLRDRCLVDDERVRELEKKLEQQDAQHIERVKNLRDDVDKRRRLLGDCLRAIDVTEPIDIWKIPHRIAERIKQLEAENAELRAEYSAAVNALEQCGQEVIEGETHLCQHIEELANENSELTLSFMAELDDIRDCIAEGFYIDEPTEEEEANGGSKTLAMVQEAVVQHNLLRKQLAEKWEPATQFKEGQYYIFQVGSGKWVLVRHDCEDEPVLGNRHTYYEWTPPTPPEPLPKVPKVPKWLNPEGALGIVHYKDCEDRPAVALSLSHENQLLQVVAFDRISFTWNVENVQLYTGSVELPDGTTTTIEPSPELVAALGEKR